MLNTVDWALLFMRVSVSLLLLKVHGLPKLLHFSQQVQVIEDPFGLGGAMTVSLAVFAEVLCPLLIIFGVFTRLACLPVIVLLLVSLLLVHPQWSLEEGQFAWLLLILFTALTIAGGGRIAAGRSVFAWQNSLQWSH
ncbi:DoxX family protein [Pseudomonas sp. NPDC078700]|uniref:DoxX family protein n=1 Tax=Pseudomonas sp. NPDC078700 TaxID=3364424 RepID=UPI0037C8BBD1